MSFQILKIDLDSLIQIEPLLSASAGYNTSMPEELDFFASTSSKNWFFAADESRKPVGFVRSFDQGDWSQGELFVLPGENRSLIATKLLERFLESNKFQSGHRLRFDILTSDVELKSSIEQLGLNQKTQTFLYYELKLEKKILNKELDKKIVSTSEVAEALGNLHPVTLEEVESWIKSDSIRTTSSHGRVAAAAQIFSYGDAAEINRIATNSNFLRRGFSKMLIQNICDELSQSGVERLFLKVEDVRGPAIAFYESFGFVRNQDKTQTWFSKHF